MVHYMRKDSRRRPVAGSKIPRKLSPDENPLLAAIVVKPVPSQAKVLLIGLASAAFESALSEDAECVLVAFALMREAFRELEAIVEQMSRGAAPTTAAEGAPDVAPRIPPKQQRITRVSRAFEK